MMEEVVQRFGELAVRTPQGGEKLELTTSLWRSPASQSSFRFLLLDM